MTKQERGRHKLRPKTKLETSSATLAGRETQKLAALSEAEYRRLRRAAARKLDLTIGQLEGRSQGPTRG
jgi:hypothetical protein